MNLAKVIRHKQFALYAIIGLSGVALDSLLFLLLFNVFGFEKNIATFISISIAIANNFLWNYHFNFKLKTSPYRRFAKFYAVGLAGIALTSLMFLIFTDTLNINANYVKLGSLPLILCFQYGLNKYWTFRHETT